MRRVPATISGATQATVGKVITLAELASDWQPDLQYFVLVQSVDEHASAVKVFGAGATNVAPIWSSKLASGDVVSIRSGRNEALVHYRTSDRHHSLLLTNRCNSNCLMCSQPPTPQDDSWLVDEAIDVVRHIRESPLVLGLSGGEPLLLGARLREVLDFVSQAHPTTTVEVLTNGRLLARPDLSRQVLDGVSSKVRWLVPLYGHADFVHDFVVQAPGAYEQTLAGLLALQEYEQSVQLRVVLIKPVLEVLPELCRFIGRNLPFVREVALMAAEPIGFAIANREFCEVDLADWAEILTQSARVLKRHWVPFLFMNAPLCGLPRSLWPHAHKSISDWKNTYCDECERCTVKEQCAGLFSWHERGWTPTRVRAIEESAA